MNLKPLKKQKQKLYPEYAQIEADFPEVTFHFDFDWNYNADMIFWTLFFFLFSKSIRVDLAKRGHTTNCFDYGGSVVQGIQDVVQDVVHNRIFAYSDQRKGNFILHY